MTTTYNGLSLNLGNLSRISNAETRSISAENFTGEKGKGGMATEGTGASAAREMGVGWKISPCITVPGSTTVTLADIEGPGAIQQMWFTILPKYWRVPHPAHLLGWRGNPIGRSPPWRFLLQRLVHAHQRHVAAGRRQPSRWAQLLLGNALPPPRQDHDREPHS